MKTFKFLMLNLLFLSSQNTGWSQNIPELRHEDKVRIKEVLTITEAVGDKLWEGFQEVPFIILLVTDNTEFLINHPSPSEDFQSLGYDTFLNSEIYYRDTQFNSSFLATFPAVNGFNCVVVGTPENTHQNSSQWVITLLHEHFHQLQYAQADYYQAVNDLDLANGDQTGMWMLNYPFPYEDAAIIQQYTDYTQTLSELVHAKEEEFETYWKVYQEERTALKEMLSDADYRYFSFQIWQEGIARYTEYKYLRLLEDYQASEELKQLSDFESFADLKDKMYQNELNNLTNLVLPEAQRICFYSIGFAEGLLLDRMNPNWREKYFEDKFYVENYY